MYTPDRVRAQSSDAIGGGWRGILTGALFGAETPSSASAPAAMALSVRDLRVSFREPGGRTVLAAAVDQLDVPHGAMLAVAGPSGSGKTTLLHALAGLLPPGKGRVVWGASSLGAMPEAARDRWRRMHVGIVFQDFHLIPELSARENVLLPRHFTAWRTGPSQVKRANDLLARMGVGTPDRLAALLSRGEQQRVAIARAVFARPAALLADEPTASLDATTGEAVADLLVAAAREEGATLIAVSHDPVLLSRFGTVRRMDKGVLLP